MNRIGIIGSSYMTGGHIDSNGVEQPFLIKDIEDNFQDTDIKFYSSAQGGFGSELYLGAITHLKNKFDIDHVIMEWGVDRSLLSVPIEPTTKKGYFKTCWMGPNIIQESYAQNKFKNFTTRIESKRLKPQYRDFLLRLDDIERTYFYTMLHLRQSINLCKMLNISITACIWHGKWTKETIDRFSEEDIDAEVLPKDPTLYHKQENMIRELKLVLNPHDRFMTWGGYDIGREYFVRKYGLNGHTGKDNVHLDRVPQREAAQMISNIIKEQRKCVYGDDK